MPCPVGRGIGHAPGKRSGRLRVIIAHPGWPLSTGSCCTYYCGRDRRAAGPSGIGLRPALGQGQRHPVPWPWPWSWPWPWPRPTAIVWLGPDRWPRSPSGRPMPPPRSCPGSAPHVASPTADRPPWPRPRSATACSTSTPTPWTRPPAPFADHDRGATPTATPISHTSRSSWTHDPAGRLPARRYTGSPARGAMTGTGQVLAQCEVHGKKRDHPLPAPVRSTCVRPSSPFDVLHPQTGPARLLVEDKGAHYIALLKANHPARATTPGRSGRRTSTGTNVARDRGARTGGQPPVRYGRQLDGRRGARPDTLRAGTAQATEGRSNP